MLFASSRMGDGVRRRTSSDHQRILRKSSAKVRGEKKKKTIIYDYYNRERERERERDCFERLVEYIITVQR